MLSFGAPDPAVMRQLLEILDRPFDHNYDYQDEPTIDTVQQLIANDLQERLGRIAGRTTQDLGITNEVKQIVGPTHFLRWPLYLPGQG